MWYHWYMYHDVLCSIHHVAKIKTFHVHAHVPWFDVWCRAVNMDFHGGKVWRLCADISWITYKIYSCSDSCSMNLCFLRFNISYCSHIVFLSVLWFFLVEDEFYCVCSRLFFSPWDKWTSLLHIGLVHTSAFILNRYLYPNISNIFAVDVVRYWFHCDCIFFWDLCDQGSLCLFFYIVYGCIFECCHMVDSLSDWSDIILVFTGSLHADVTFLWVFFFWDHMGLRFWCIHFYFSKFHFWKINKLG